MPASAIKWNADLSDDIDDIRLLKLKIFVLHEDAIQLIF